MRIFTIMLYILFIIMVMIGVIFINPNIGESSSYSTINISQYTSMVNCLKFNQTNWSEQRSCNYTNTGDK